METANSSFLQPLDLSPLVGKFSLGQCVDDGRCPNVIAIPIHVEEVVDKDVQCGKPVVVQHLRDNIDKADPLVLIDELLEELVGFLHLIPEIPAPWTRLKRDDIEATLGQGRVNLGNQLAIGIRNPRGFDISK